MLQELKQRARRLKHETYALYLVARHPDTPWYTKAFVAGVVAYALSPIDLIPDFIPVLGYLDDLILLPAGIVIAVKLTPEHVLSECRAQATEAFDRSARVGRAATVVIVAIWLGLSALVIGWLLKLFAR